MMIQSANEQIKQQSITVEKKKDKIQTTDAIQQFKYEQIEDSRAPKVDLTQTVINQTDPQQTHR